MMGLVLNEKLNKVKSMKTNLSILIIIGLFLILTMIGLSLYKQQEKKCKEHGGVPTSIGVNLSVLKMETS